MACFRWAAELAILYAGALGAAAIATKHATLLVQPNLLSRPPGAGLKQAR
jgi:hypothetical protein